MSFSVLNIVRKVVASPILMAFIVVSDAIFCSAFSVSGVSSAASGAVLGLCQAFFCGGAAGTCLLSTAVIESRALGLLRRRVAALYSGHPLKQVP